MTSLAGQFPHWTGHGGGRGMAQTGCGGLGVLSLVNTFPGPTHTLCTMWFGMSVCAGGSL